MSATDLQKEILTAQQVAPLSSPRPQWIAVAVEMRAFERVELALFEYQSVRIFQCFYRFEERVGDLAD